MRWTARGLAALVAGVLLGSSLVSGALAQVSDSESEVIFEFRTALVDELRRPSTDLAIPLLIGGLHRDTTQEAIDFLDEVLSGLPNVIQAPEPTPEPIPEPTGEPTPEPGEAVAPNPFADL